MKLKLILVAICLSMVSLLNMSTVMAEEITSGNFIYQQLQDGTISIIRYTGDEENVVIPETIDGYEVSTIGRAFNNIDHVKSIVIPDTVTEIGDYAFSRCKNLGEITIPANVETIGSHVFYLCDELVSIDVDSSNSKFFSYNGALYCKESDEDITLLIYPPGLDGGNEYFVYDGTTEIADNAFVECREVLSVIVPSKVKRIGIGAFLSCTSLRSIYLPDSLKEIGTDAFYNCTGLTKIYYEGGIGEWNIVFQYHDELPDTEIYYNYVRRENPIGDVNGDRQINAVDAILILQYAAQMSDLGQQSRLSADVTGEGDINAKDALDILKHAAKLIDKFPGAY